MKKLLLLLILLLLPAPSWAQADVVASVKANLLARGVNLSGECGGFAITQRVAWQLRGTGAGLLSKPSGSNCQGFATDIIAYADGRIVDILSDSGGSNGPQWNPGEPVDASRWRAAIDPGDSPSPSPTPQPTPVPSVYTDLSGVYLRFDDNAARLERMFADMTARDAARAAELAALKAQLTAHDNEPAWAAKVLGNRYVQLALAGVGTWFGAQAAK